MRNFSDKILVVLPRLNPHINRNLRLSDAYVNLVGFFQKRHEMEIHVISSAGSYAIVPKMKDVRTVLAVHPADVEFVNGNVMPLDANGQDIFSPDAYEAAAKRVSFVRGQSVEDRTVDASDRERVAVNHIVQKYYRVIVDFEHPRISVYKLSPKVADLYFRVPTLNLTVKGYLSGDLLPLHDLRVLLQYDGVHKPLGCWERGVTVIRTTTFS
jgi:hypothetical protein